MDEIASAVILISGKFSTFTYKPFEKIQKVVFNRLMKAGEVHKEGWVLKSKFYITCHARSGLMNTIIKLVLKYLIVLITA